MNPEYCINKEKIISHYQDVCIVKKTILFFGKRF